MQSNCIGVRYANSAFTREGRPHTGPPGLGIVDSDMLLLELSRMPTPVGPVRGPPFAPEVQFTTLNCIAVRLAHCARSYPRAG